VTSLIYALAWHKVEKTDSNAVDHRQASLQNKKTLAISLPRCMT